MRLSTDDLRQPSTGHDGYVVFLAALSWFREIISLPSQSYSATQASRECGSTRCEARGARQSNHLCCCTTSFAGQNGRNENDDQMYRKLDRASHRSSIIDHRTTPPRYLWICSRMENCACLAFAVSPRDPHIVCSYPMGCFGVSNMNIEWRTTT